MATMQKCGLSSGSPNGIPFMHRHRQRRVTLVTLLRDPIDGDRRSYAPPPRRRRRTVSEGRRSTLKELLLATNPFDRTEEQHHQQEAVVREVREMNGGIPPLVMGGGGGGFGRRGIRTAGLRFRFFRRAWRPMLVAIPE